MERMKSKKIAFEATVFRSIKPTIATIINSRLNGLSKLEGYPLPSQVVATLYDLIDLSSMGTVYSSLARIQKLAYVASEVMKSISLERMERHQITRKDVEASVITMAVHSNKLGVTITMEEAEKVAFMLTATDVDESSWRLAMHNDKKENLVFKIFNLYKSIGDADTSALSGTPDSPLVWWDTASRTDSEFGTVIHWTSAPEYVTLIPTAAANPTSPQAQSLKATALVVQLAQIRVLDHLVALLFDTDIWIKFISVRSSAPGATQVQNIERANSLSGLAMYCQCLLTYPAFFVVEFQKQLFERISTWYIAFPELSSEILINYQTIVRKNDLLNAYADVEQLFSTCNFDDDVIGTKIHVLFTEFLTTLGLDKIKEIAEEAETKLSGIDSFDRLKELFQQANVSLLLAQPIAQANFMMPLTAAVINNKLYSSVLVSLIPSILSKMGLWYTDLNIKRVQALSLSLNAPWAIKYPASRLVDKTTPAEVSNGVVNFRPFAPKASLAYTTYLRDNKMMAVTPESDTSIVGFYPKYLVDRDQADSMRDLWKIAGNSLYPYTEGEAISRYKINSIYKDKWLMKTVIENVSKLEYESFIASLNSDYDATKLATLFSSFAFIMKLNVGTGEYERVDGFSKPYGVTYSDLYNYQGYNLKSKNPDINLIREYDLVSDVLPSYVSADGTKPYFKIRFLNRVPGFTNALDIDTDVFLGHIRYYFSGSVASKKDEPSITSAEFQDYQMNKLIFDDSLLHFTRMIIPPLNHVFETRVLYSGLHAYLNNRLFINTDFEFIPQVQANDLYSLPVTTVEWKRPSYIRFLKFKKFISYPSSNLIASSQDGLADEEKMMINMTKQIETKTLELNEITAAQSDANLKANVKGLEKDVVADTAKTFSEGSAAISAAHASSHHGGKNKKKGNKAKPANLAKGIVSAELKSPESLHKDEQEKVD